MAPAQPLQSLYTRYRPQRFADVVGQKDAVKLFSNAVASDHPGSFYIISGPTGTGKTTLARIFAKAVNCTERSDGDSEPCNECLSCMSIDSQSSQDVSEANAASSGGVDSARNLAQTAHTMPFGKRRVIILDEAHQLTNQAQSALLKPLEDVPDNVTWIMATTDPQKLMNTIRGRAQIVRLGYMTDKQISKHLAKLVKLEGLEVNDAMIQIATKAACGSMRTGITEIEVAAAGGHNGTSPMWSIVSALMEADASSALVSINEAISSGSNAKLLCEGIISMLRDMLVMKSGVQIPNISYFPEEEAEKVLSSVSSGQILGLIEIFGSVMSNIGLLQDARVGMELGILLAIRRSEADQEPANLVIVHGSHSGNAPGSEELNSLKRRVKQLERGSKSTHQGKHSNSSRFHPLVLVSNDQATTTKQVASALVDWASAHSIKLKVGNS